MLANFHEIAASVPHNGLKGREAEGTLSEFLRRCLPKRFEVGTGFVIDLKEGISKQTEVIIYDAHNCPVYRSSGDAGVFPVDNVAVVIEVKSRLNKEEMYDAAAKIGAVKSLVSAETEDNGHLEFREPLGILFAFSSDLSDAKQLEHYKSATMYHGGLLRHIDLVSVLGRSLQTLVFLGPDKEWHQAIIDGFPPDSEGMEIGVGILQLGDSTLDHFYRHLLARLARFRSIVPHPGFAAPGKEMLIQHFCTYTEEPKKLRAGSL